MTMYVSSRIRNSAADTLTTNDDGFGAKSYPNWCRWVDTGTTGTVTADGAVSPATGGEYTNKPHAVIDLSAALSHMLGRQMMQNQTYRINYLAVEVENDDAGDNNDESISITGRFRWYSPSAHRIDAYQTYRKAWRINSGGGSEGTSRLFAATDSTQGEYKALRVGICDDSTEQVPYQTVDPFTDISGSFPNLYHIFDSYDNALAQNGDEMTNRLWRDGRTGHPQAVSFSAYNKNAGSNGVGSENIGFQMGGYDIDAMCGLLHFVIDTTQSDDLFSFDDEYHIRITVGVEGYGGEF